MPRPSLRFLRLPTTRARRRRLLTMLLAFFTLLTFLTPFYIIYKPPYVLIRYFPASLARRLMARDTTQK